MTCIVGTMEASNLYESIFSADPDPKHNTQGRMVNHDYLVPWNCTDKVKITKFEVWNIITSMFGLFPFRWPVNCNRNINYRHVVHIFSRVDKVACVS
jgi:hypothetical protein